MCLEYQYLGQCEIRDDMLSFESDPRGNSREAPTIGTTEVEVVDLLHHLPALMIGTTEEDALPSSSSSSSNDRNNRGGRSSSSSSSSNDRSKRGATATRADASRNTGTTVLCVSKTTEMCLEFCDVGQYEVRCDFADVSFNLENLVACYK